MFPLIWSCLWVLLTENNFLIILLINVYGILSLLLFYPENLTDQLAKLYQSCWMLINDFIETANK